MPNRKALFILTILCACSHPSEQNVMIKTKMTNGGQLISEKSNCPDKPKSNSIDDGMFSMEGQSLIVTTKFPNCVAKQKWTAMWISETRVEISNPQWITNCSKTSVDTKARVTLDFESAENKIRMISSQRRGCFWLHWKGA